MRGNIYKLLFLVLLLLLDVAVAETVQGDLDSQSDRSEDYHDPVAQESESADTTRSWAEMNPKIDGTPITRDEREFEAHDDPNDDDDDESSKSQHLSNQSTQETDTQHQQQPEQQHKDESTSTITSTTATPHTEGSKQRLWGSSASASAAASTHGEHTDHERNETTGQAPHGLPFVAKSKHHHVPPEGFTLTARVYVDPDDKLAHFDDSVEGVTLPYWDCGVVGSTTAPLPIKHATFRHCLVASTTTYFSSGSSTTASDVSSTVESSSDLHPVIMIPLTPVTVELNSGARRECLAGDVILLEDALLPGHKIRPIQTDALILFLTLPQSHFHTGREHLSIRAAVRKNNKRDPCPADHDATEHSNSRLIIDWRYPGRNGRQLRQLLSGAIGISLFALAADFLGKVAPLWLAVGIGGTFFVAGGTYVTVLLGEYLWNSWEFWQEKRRLRSAAHNNNVGLKDASLEEIVD